MADAVKIPESLQVALQNHTLVPFVGAGLSMSVLRKDSEDALFPNWSQLLHLAAAQLIKEDKPNAAKAIEACLGYIEDDAYLRAAKIAQKELGKKLWNGFLKEHLDPPRNHCESASLATAEKVWQLGSKLIITTNYDRVLDWARPAELRNELALWPIEATFEQQQSLTTPVKRPTLWHLHGHVDNINKVILTPDGYQALYGDVEESTYKAALKSLHDFLAHRTLLFIGFSFTDEIFYRQLKTISNIYDGNTTKHYVLIKDDQEKAVNDLGLPLQTICYQDHSDLPDVLAQLAGLVEQPTIITAEEPAKETERTSQKFSPDNNVFHVPYNPKGEGVVGREDSLLQLRNQLVAGKRTSIGHAAAFKGMGGLGKTQLAIEYAYRYKGEYPKGVMWITADQEISSQLIAIATAAKWISPNADHKDILQAAIKRITSYSDCLVIFDNVDKLSQIKPYLPKKGSGANPHLLITSRDAHKGFTAIELALLTSEQALALLFKEADRDLSQTPVKEVEAAEAICAELGYLPLAVEIAGAYLKSRTIIQCRDYQQMLADNLAKATNSEEIDSFTEHEQDLFLTLQITESEISRSPQLSQILQLLSWSASSSMGLSLMGELLKIPKFDLLDALSLGVELRLLTASEDGQRYSIHRLLQQIQRVLSPLDKHTELGQRICNRMIDWFKQRRRDFNYLTIFEAEQDHLDKWVTLAKHNKWVQNAGLIWLQSYPYWHLGKYQQSHNLLQQSLAWLGTYQITETQLKADIFDDYATILSYLDKQNEAFNIRQEVLELRLHILGKEHPDIALSYNNIGASYSEFGQYEQALEFHQNALALWLLLLGEKHPDVALSQNNIGTTYHELRQYEQALIFYKKALALRLELLGGNHPYVAQSYKCIGRTYLDSKRHEQALLYFQKSLTVWRELFGPVHPETVSSLENLLVALVRLKQFTKANDTLYQFKKPLPDIHPHKQKLAEIQDYINRESSEAGFRATSLKPKAKKKLRKKNKRR